ncbi:OLC1v1005836C1 [Oldenlandia corymbosa var. corymbosa]|uniref:OLC1v1005836C1 n=1 Tax=Oldenlandia corymbosa var. corymbosa TaxID=529605 RepID=A0AAV1DI82_OLDCO|nr:OLC1v1005836C1 [Oldenlandia corymbosa var. corymbosa]
MAKKKRRKYPLMKPHEPFLSVVTRRPYLFEAWEILYRRKEKKPLMYWKVPQERNEIVMKDTLR